MDEWRLAQQQQQQQHRMASGGIGPVLSYPSMRARSSPYPMNELKQSYSYSQNGSNNPLSPSAGTTPNSNPNLTPPMSGSNENNESSTPSLDDLSGTTSNSDVYTPNNTNVTYTPVQMEQIPQQAQQHMMSVKSAAGPMVGYHPGQQQMMAARARSMPYPMPPPSSHHHQHHPSMYSHPPGAVCQCAQHMHSNHPHYPVHGSSHPMYYQQQQSEAWYRYQQHAAWRQHQIHQHPQQHLPHQHQPVPMGSNFHEILAAEGPSTTKLKASKAKTKKKQPTTPLLNEDPSVKYQPLPPSSLNLRMQHSQSAPTQRVCLPATSTTYYPSVYSTSNSYQTAQQLPPPPQDHPMYTQTSPPTLAHHQSQVFTSPLSNPGTPHQLYSNGEFNGTVEFGVPYHHAAPGSVNSLTDALCPGGDTSDRQMTPGPPSVGTPRVAPHQYSFPHTPSTPQTINSQSTNPHTPVMMPPTPNPLSAPPTPLTRPRSSEQTQSTSTSSYQHYEQHKSMNNVDDLAAYLKDPTNIYLTDDVTSTLFDDIDALADTYLGQQSASQQANHVDNNSAEDILLNFLCSDDVTHGH